MLKPGGTLAQTFILRSPTTGSLANAGSTPTAVLRRNGVTDGTVTVTVANNATGDYSASAVIPGGYADGDVVQIVVSATVEGVADKFPLPSHAIGTVAADMDTALVGIADILNVVETTGVKVVDVSGVAIDDGKSMKEVLAYIQAVLYGRLSGADGDNLQFKTPSGGANRVLVVADADNNRTAITLTPLS